LTLVKAIIDGLDGYVSVMNKDDKDISKGSIIIIEIPKEH